MKIEILVAAVALIAAGNVAAQGCMPWVEIFAAADTDYGGRFTKDECDHHVDAGKLLGFNPRFPESLHGYGCGLEWLTCKGRDDGWYANDAGHGRGRRDRLARGAQLQPK